MRNMSVTGISRVSGQTGVKFSRSDERKLPYSFLHVKPCQIRGKLDYKRFQIFIYKVKFHPCQTLLVLQRNF